MRKYAFFLVFSFVFWASCVIPKQVAQPQPAPPRQPEALQDPRPENPYPKRAQARAARAEERRKVRKARILELLKKDPLLQKEREACKRAKIPPGKALRFVATGDICAQRNGERVLRIQKWHIQRIFSAQKQQGSFFQDLLSAPESELIPRVQRQYNRPGVSKR